MRYQADADSYNFILTLQTGERWLDAFAEFTVRSGVESAWLNIIGGAQNIILGYYSLDTKQYQWQTFDDLYEITSLQGNITADKAGKPMTHLHGTFGDAQFNVVGGHVKDFVAGATVEVFVHRFDTPLRRKTDVTVGLQLLDLPESI